MPVPSAYSPPHSGQGPGWDWALMEVLMGASGGGDDGGSGLWSSHLSYPLKRVPHRHAQGLVSGSALDFIKFTTVAICITHSLCTQITCKCVKHCIFKESKSNYIWDFDRIILNLQIDKIKPTNIPAKIILTLAILDLIHNDGFIFICLLSNSFYLCVW